MYIDKYWGNYIGGTDDSLTLLDYLTDKQKSEIPLSEIFADTGLYKQNWGFRKTIEWLQYTDQNGMEQELPWMRAFYVIRMQASIYRAV